MAFLDLEAPCSSDILLEERLDFRDPLRHLMQQQDDELQDVISADGLARASASASELLNALPQQCHSVENGVLKLSFLHQWGISNPLSIVLHLDASPGCGGLAWPAGQILASYLVQKGPEYFRAKTIVELGSGTGLVGLVVGSFRNAGVWITDQAPLLEVMRHNVVLNQLEATVRVAELNWGFSPPTDIRSPNIILAADCVYFEPAFPLLVKTLDDLSDQTTEIFFCYKKRRKADKRFFSFLRKKFTWKEVTDDSNLHAYNREGITLLRLFKVRSQYQFI